MTRCILMCKNMTHLGGKERTERSFLVGSSAYSRHLHPQQADDYMCFPHISPAQPIMCELLSSAIRKPFQKYTYWCNPTRLVLS